MLDRRASARFKVCCGLDVMASWTSDQMPAPVRMRCAWSAFQRSRILQSQGSPFLAPAMTPGRRRLRPSLIP